MWQRNRYIIRNKPHNFFFLILKAGDSTEITRLFNKLSKEARGIIDEVIHLAYFMRGSISYNDFMFMTYVEREAVSDFLEKRLEAESKKPHPIY